MFHRFDHAVLSLFSIDMLATPWTVKQEDDHLYSVRQNDKVLGTIVTAPWGGYRVVKIGEAA